MITINTHTQLICDRCGINPVKIFWMRFDFGCKLVEEQSGGDWYGALALIDDKQVFWPWFNNLMDQQDMLFASEWITDRSFQRHPIDKSTLHEMYCDHLAKAIKSPLMDKQYCYMIDRFINATLIKEAK